MFLVLIFAAKMPPLCLHPCNIAPESAVVASKSAIVVGKANEFVGISGAVVMMVSGGAVVMMVSGGQVGALLNE